MASAEKSTSLRLSGKMPIALKTGAIEEDTSIRKTIGKPVGQYLEQPRKLKE